MDWIFFSITLSHIIISILVVSFHVNIIFNKHQVDMSIVNIKKYDIENIPNYHLIKHYPNQIQEKIDQIQ